MIELCGNIADQSRIEPPRRERQVLEGCRIVAVTLNVIVDLCQRTTGNRLDHLRKKLESILSTCLPRLLTAKAGFSTQTRRSLAPIAVILLHVSTFHSLLLAKSSVPAVSPELAAQLPLLWLRPQVLSRSTQSFMSLIFQHFPALTTARNSHVRPHNATSSY